MRETKKVTNDDYTTVKTGMLSLADASGDCYLSFEQNGNWQKLAKA